MNIIVIEGLLANLAEILLMPVLIIILLLLIYAIYAMGDFVGQDYMRKKNATVYFKNLVQGNKQWLAGYPVHNYYINNPNACQDELEVFALKKLEILRLITRIAPMLGLIGTMIPMGPALKALADGNIQGISENLIIAFAAVIWALVIATLTYWPASVKKRWFATELVNIRKLNGE